jgi:hypothetical protein
LPEAALTARRVAAEKDWRVTPVAFRLFGGRAQPPDAQAALSQIPVPAVARLAAVK